jgi:C-terminal processing protease CtpA/Prc
LYHTIFDLNGTKIGYLVYTEFITGKSNEYLDSIAKVINKFKVANVREMIVDLRYNPGGEIDAAVYLASALAPQSATSSKSTLISLKYNSLLQTEFDSNKSKYADYLGYNFLNTTPNMNLSRVYFLTTNRTASASELVISGLMAYMDVSIIGENTYGKYVGAWVIPSDKYNWAMVPIVMKYSNANGYSNFDNGLPPNYLIDDNLLEAVPFGDASDPMVAKAIGLITGSPVAVAQTKSAHILPGKPIVSAKEKLRSNLILPLPQNRLTQ